MFQNHISISVILEHITKDINSWYWHGGGHKNHPPTLQVGMLTWPNCLTNNILYKKLRIKLHRDPAMLLLGIYSRAQKFYLVKIFEPHVHCNIIPNTENSQCPRTYDWKGKLWNTYVMECYSAIRWNHAISHCSWIWKV